VLKLQQLEQSDETLGRAQMKIIKINETPREVKEDMAILVFFIK